MRYSSILGITVISLALLGGGCTLLPTADKSASSGPRIEMPNKVLSKTNTFTIDKVVVDQDGWVVMRNELNAEPTEVLAYAPVKTGENTNIVLTINRDDATAQEYIELYTDTGTVGTFDFEKRPGSFDPDIKEQPMLGNDGKPVVLKFIAEVE